MFKLFQNYHKHEEEPFRVKSSKIQSINQ